MFFTHEIPDNNWSNHKIDCWSHTTCCNVQSDRHFPYSVNVSIQSNHLLFEDEEDEKIYKEHVCKYNGHIGDTIVNIRVTQGTRCGKDIQSIVANWKSIAIIESNASGKDTSENSNDRGIKSKDSLKILAVDTNFILSFRF